MQPPLAGVMPHLGMRHAQAQPQMHLLAMHLAARPAMLQSPQPPPPAPSAVAASDSESEDNE